MRCTHFSVHVNVQVDLDGLSGKGVFCLVEIESPEKVHGIEGLSRYEQNNY
jgi:hypothetical protein